LIVISGGTFSSALVNFLGGIGQAVRVDVNANPTTGTAHVFTRFQSPYLLFKVMAAVRALKFDHVDIDIRHQSLSLPGRPFGA
jgi:hypothetical protein